MGRHRKKRAGLPVRTGLLGASAAMAVGAVAVTTGILPVGDTYTIGSSSNESPVEIRTGGPALLQTQGEAGTTPTPSSSATPSRTPQPSKSPAKPSPTKRVEKAKPSAKPSPTKPAAKAKPSAKPSPTKRVEKAKPSAKPSKKPVEKKTPAPEPEKTTSAPVREPSREADRPESRPSSPTAAPTSDTSATEAAVLNLVNEERAKVGCSPFKASPALAELARVHSKDMAVRGFFDHTNPDGQTPWDRAAAANVANLGGENIARGQADAGAVLNAWMQSEGHRANILNCDFTTMGVGVYMGDGGPWWTQNFGY
ncbi:CAP domain-containing protein [Streptomyces sp. PKU-EA00015]|uniref:CAP domain-containing protein n=1 Tax=Streptomyces sp. PKU-EA00015 TaxID=2748326 RepID=UPI0015A45DA1|nr:CAP domain-containing protein [Streptomyces sp. PKU-EA00015]NWF28935.1 CAP domain-containing protein [Streptomyces sp. PKU-EA00015]